MKLERLSQNKIKYSISFEELVNKGFLEDGIESFIWHDLFDEMVEVAKKEYHFEATDTISIEIYSLNSKEIVLILTIDEITDIIEENIPLIETNQKNIFVFETIEDVILLSFCLDNLNVKVESKLLQFEDQYYLIIYDKKSTIYNSICEEYGTRTNLSSEFIEEYAVSIIENNALEMIANYFSK